MVGLANLIAAQDYGLVPELRKGDVELLWVEDWWDFPVSGALRYKGRLHWFQMWKQAEWFETEGSPAIYLVIRLTDRQMADQLYWHDLFVQMVSDIWNYDETGVLIRNHPGNRQTGTAETTAEFQRLQQGRAVLDLSSNQVVGWFRMTATHNYSDCT